MQLGTPVVASNLEIFTEVTGLAGSYFNPEDPRTFASSVIELTDASHWEAKSKESIAQANLFDWNKSADALLDVFNKLDS